jgi:peroxiredoxin
VTDPVEPNEVPAVPAPRKPRKIFLAVGLVLAVALGIGLFSSVGNKKADQAPKVGGPVPAFSAARINGSGSVSVPSTRGTPTVILFFGRWCSECHTELPPLAAAVRHQDSAGGALAHIRVVGVDSEDTLAHARGFVKSSGVTFPVVCDPNIEITSGDFFLYSDPNAVFVNGNGVITRIARTALSPSAFIADEKALIPSES